MEGKNFHISSQKHKTGKYMKREYFGLGRPNTVFSGLGKTTFRAEGLWGMQRELPRAVKVRISSSRPANIENKRFIRSSVFSVISFI
jgi:hypothetical protein